MSADRETAAAAIGALARLVRELSEEVAGAFERGDYDRAYERALSGVAALGMARQDVS